MKIERQYIVNEQNHKTAVLLDIDTFEKIEEILENYALYHFMEDGEDNEILDSEEAEKYYRKMVENQ